MNGSVAGIVVFLAVFALAGWVWMRSGGKHRQGDTAAAPASASGAKMASPQLLAQLAVINAKIFPALSRHQLPARPERFSGHKELTNALLALASRKPVFIGVYGPHGVGKTALGLRLCQKFAQEYSDGQFYLDLMGGGSRPLSPVEVMHHVLHAWHPTLPLPSDKIELLRLYRSTLKGKRVLFFLDNATTPRQIKPLVPTRTSLLLVTSEKPLSLPGMVSREVPVLSKLDANNLLLYYTPRIGYWNSEIARLCGFSPLAIRFAGSYLSIYPEIPPLTYVEKLREEHKKIQVRGEPRLRDYNEIGFYLSYRQLSEDAAGVLRKCSVFSGAFDEEAEAFVCNDRQSEHLGTLSLMGMVEFDKLNNRYFLHPEIRTFLEARGKGKELEKTARYHAMHYRSVLQSAYDVSCEGEEGLACGLNLFDINWPNIRAGQAWAAAHMAEGEELTRLCNDYCHFATPFMALRLPPADCVDWLGKGLTAARNLGSTDVELSHLLNLGTQFNRMNHPVRAIEFLSQAQALACNLGRANEEIAAFHQVGLAYLSMGKMDPARASFDHELEIMRRVNLRQGEETVLELLGRCHLVQEAFDPARNFFETAAALARKAGDVSCEMRALTGLGEACLQLNDTGNAIKFLQQGLGLVRKGGKAAEQARLLQLIGDGFSSNHDFTRALEHYKNSLSLLRKHQIPGREAGLMKRQGDVLIHLKRYQDGISRYERAAFLAGKEGDRRLEGKSLWHLGLALEKMGDRPRAIIRLKDALTLYEQTGHPDAQKLRHTIDKLAGETREST